MTDVRLFQVDDGGELVLAGPLDTTTDIKLDTGLETAVYLSWFGGNERDPGVKNGAPHEFQWWGNIGEPAERKQLSETGHLIRGLPATSNNLLKIEDAMVRDVQRAIDDDTFDEELMTAALVAKNRIRLTARIGISKEEFVIAFEVPWGE